MVGYNDAYNRALTAKSNALQRRKGEMIDRLNGSGRGDEEDEDDYLSEEDMEGGGAYEDEYEDEMVGGSFEDASREVGGAMAYGGAYGYTGGKETGGAYGYTGGFNSVGGRLTGGFLPMFLASAAAPLVGSLVSRLFGGAYVGGARKVKSAMMRDLMGSGADERLKPAFPIFTDMAYKVGSKVMKGRGSYGITGGRAVGGNPLAMLAMAAAPALGQAFGKLFGLGKNDPIMRGAGFFDFIKDLGGKLQSGLSAVGNVLAPAASWAKDNLLPIAGDVAKELFKQKLTGKFLPKAPAAGKGKKSPYDLAYGGARCCPSCKGSGYTVGAAMSAQNHFDREDERLAMEVKGLKDSNRRDKEKRYALGAGGKRLYMKGGVGGQLAAMGQESMFGYDNDEQPSGLVPPRNVATKGYLTGCGAMPMYSCGGRKRNMKMLKSGYALGTPDAMEGSAMTFGGRALTPVAQMRPTIGAGKGSAWIQHVKAYAAKHGVSYKDALKSAAASYRK
jgi:hypothetical protein